MTSLESLLRTKRFLLADGATGTNLFAAGLGAGDPPELWNVDRPEAIADLYRAFVEAGSDLILTNTFGANSYRLKLHKAEGRVFELNKAAAEIARAVANTADRPVVIAGSVGPSGELFEPLGEMTEAGAVEAFTEQARGLKAGGADLAWIETMSAPEEIRAAARGAIAAGLPYTATASFDTAGHTMMGLSPDALAAVFADLPEPPIAFGANCGVGASDLVMSVLDIVGAAGDIPVIAKANAGIPHFRGDEIHYSGTPELMADYARLAADSGARIIGGCCGSTPAHVRAMRAALDGYSPGGRPDRGAVETSLGALVAPPSHGRARERQRRRG